MRQLLAVVLLLLSAADARAQADHKWIQENPWYKDTNGVHCCSVDHCRPMEHGFAREVSQGWFVPSTGQMFTHQQLGKGLFYSKDWQVHACMGTTSEGKPRVICLFVTPSGA
jgi:hypothetical protein